MENKDAKKIYYSISEVASMLDIPASTLRYWEKELASVNPRRSQGGTRRYTEADIKELRVVHRLVKSEGHTIEGVKKIMRSRRNAELNRQEALRRLVEIRGELAGMLDEIDRISTEK